MISGNATFTIVVSISSSREAMITVMVMIHFLNPCSAMTQLFCMYNYLHAHPGSQRPPDKGGVGFDPDPHRYPLYDLYEVAGGIVGWQQGKFSACRTGKRF